MNHWTVGIDFGRQNDRTAIAAIEVVPPTEREPESSKPFLDMRYLHRLPVGVPYPEQCSFIAALVDGTAELRGSSVIVDASGVGVAVADTLKEQMRAGFTELTITGGSKVKADGRKLSVPKRDLVSRLAVVMQSRRLRVSEGLSEAADLYRELAAFSVSISESGSDSYGARSGHDDLVLALSYAVWQAERTSSAAEWSKYLRGMASPASAPEPVVVVDDGLSDAERLEAATIVAWRAQRGRGLW